MVRHISRSSSQSNRTKNNIHAAPRNDLKISSINGICINIQYFKETQTTSQSNLTQTLGEPELDSTTKTEALLVDLETKMTELETEQRSGGGDIFHGF